MFVMCLQVALVLIFLVKTGQSVLRLMEEVTLPASVPEDFLAQFVKVRIFELKRSLYYCKVCCLVDFTGEAPIFCGGLVHWPTGLIHSPQSAGSYLNGLHCMWLLAASIEEQQRFLFVFNTFDMRECCDSVQVYSLLDERHWSRELARSGLCIDGNTSCPCSDHFSFLGHRFYVTFTTDGSVVGEGFEISYSSVGMCIHISSSVL